MSTQAKRVWITFALAALCWVVEIFINPSNWELPFLIAATLFTLLFLSFAAISIVRKLRGRCSPYRIFALINTLVGLAITAYTVYDIRTDTGWFAGLFGVILLIFIDPVIVLLLFGKRKKRPPHVH